MSFPYGMPARPVLKAGEVQIQLLLTVKGARAVKLSAFLAQLESLPGVEVLQASIVPGIDAEYVDTDGVGRAGVNIIDAARKLYEDAGLVPKPKKDEDEDERPPATGLPSLD